MPLKNKSYFLKYSLTILVMFIYGTSIGQEDLIEEKSTSIGLEIAGLTYSNNEIGAYTGIHVSRSSTTLSFVAAPLFITENNNIRLGGVICLRGQISPKGISPRVVSHAEFGGQYFEIINEVGHYQKTLMFTTGLNVGIYYKSKRALIVHYGAGYDFGGPFVKYQSGFVGIVRASFLFSDIIKI